MPAEQSGGRPIGYSLIATPLKEATPRELEVMDAAVFAEGYFAFGATIKVIEDGLGYTRWTMARKSPMLTTRGEATEREDRVISVCYTKAGSSPTGISLFDPRNSTGIVKVAELNLKGLERGDYIVRHGKSTDPVQVSMS